MQKITNYHHRQNPVTAVIPAYNEANHIGSLLDVLSQVRTLTHIIVVDDGSTDDTPDVVRSFCKRDARIQLVCLSDNQGKGGAVLAGAQVSKNDLIVFLDAGLIELHPENVLALIEPVGNGKCSNAWHLHSRTFANRLDSLANAVSQRSALLEMEPVPVYTRPGSLPLGRGGSPQPACLAKPTQIPCGSLAQRHPRYAPGKDDRYRGILVACSNVGGH